MEEEGDYDSDSTVLLDDYDRKPHIVAAKRRKLSVKHSTGIETTDDAWNNSENTAPDKFNKNNTNNNILTGDTHSSVFSKKNSHLEHKQWHINRYFDVLNRQEDNANNEDLKIKSELLKQEVESVEDVKEEYGFENSAAKLDIVTDDVITIDDSDDDCIITEIIDNNGSNNQVNDEQPFDSFSKANDSKSRPLGINSRRVTINGIKTKETILDSTTTMCPDDELKNEPRLIVLKPATINARRATIDYSEIKHNLQIDTKVVNSNLPKTEDLNLILKERARGLNLSINETGNVINKANVETVGHYNEENSVEKINSTIGSDCMKEAIHSDSVTLNKDAGENISEPEQAILRNGLVDQQKPSKLKNKTKESDMKIQLNSDAPSVLSSSVSKNENNGIENLCNINRERTVELVSESGIPDRNIDSKDRTDEVVNIYVNAKEVSRKRISIDLTSPKTSKRARTGKETKVKKHCHQSGKVLKMNNTDSNHAKEGKVITRKTNDVGLVVDKQNKITSSDNFQINEQNEISSNIANKEVSCSSEETERVIKFHVGLCTLIKGHLKDYCQMYSADHEKQKPYIKSIESLTREIENLKDFAGEGRFKADIQYACPVCTRVSTYSAHLRYSINNINYHNFETPVKKCYFCQGIGKLYNSYLNKYLKIEEKKEYNVKGDHPSKNINNEIQEENAQTIHTPFDRNTATNDKCDDISIELVERQLSGESEKQCGESIKTFECVSESDTQTVRAENGVSELNDDSNCKADVSIQSIIPQLIAKRPEGIAQLKTSSVNQNNTTCNQEDNLVITQGNASNNLNGFSCRRSQINVLDMSKNYSEYSNPSDSSLIESITSSAIIRSLNDESDCCKMLPESDKQSSSIEDISVDAANYRTDIIVKKNKNDVSKIEINNDTLSKTDNISVNLTEYGQTSNINVSKSISGALVELDGPISTVYRVVGDNSDTIIDNTFKEIRNSQLKTVKSSKRKLNDCILKLHSKRIRNNVDVRNKISLDSSYGRADDDNALAQNASANLENGDNFDETYNLNKNDENEKLNDLNKIKTGINVICPNIIDTNACLAADKGPQNQKSKRINHEINNSESRKTNNANEVDALKTGYNLVCNSKTINEKYDTNNGEQNTNKAIHKESVGNHVTIDSHNEDQEYKHDEQERNQLELHEIGTTQTKRCVNTNHRGSETECLDGSSVVIETVNQETRRIEDQGLKTNNTKNGVELNKELKTTDTDKKHNTTEDKSETNKELNNDENEIIAEELGDGTVPDYENKVDNVNNASDEKSNTIIDALENCFDKIKNISNLTESTNEPYDISNSLNVNSQSNKGFVKAVALQDHEDTKIEIEYTCNICTCMFFYGATLLQHLRKNHCIHLTKIPIQCVTMKCSYCHEYLKHKAYNLHVKRRHPDECFKKVENYKTQDAKYAKAVIKFKKAEYDNKVIAATKTGIRYKYKCLKCPAILNSVYSVRKHRNNKHPDMRNRKLVDKVLANEKGLRNSKESDDFFCDEEQQDTYDKHCSDQINSSNDTESKGDMEYESDNNSEVAENCTENDVNEDTLDEEQDTSVHDKNNSDGEQIDQDKRNRTTSFEEDDVDNYSGHGSDTDNNTSGEIETNVKKRRVTRNQSIDTLIKDFKTLQNRKHTYGYKCTICETILKSDYAVRKHRRDKHPNMKNKKLVEKISTVVKGLRNIEKKAKLMDGEEEHESNTEEEREQQNDDNGYESNEKNDVEENAKEYTIQGSPDVCCEENYINEASDNGQYPRNRDENSIDEICEYKNNEQRQCDNAGTNERNINPKRIGIRKLQSNIKGSKTSRNLNMKNVKLVDKILITEGQQNTEKNVEQSSDDDQPVKNNENEIHLNNSKIKSIEKCDHIGNENGNGDDTDDEKKSLEKRSNFEDNSIESPENVNNQVERSVNLSATLRKDDAMENRENEKKQCETFEASRARSDDKTGDDDQSCSKNLRGTDVNQHYDTAIQKSTYECSLCKEYFYNHYEMRQHREVKHPLMNNVKIYKKVKTNYERQKKQNKKVSGDGKFRTYSIRIEKDTTNASNDEIDKYASRNEGYAMFTGEEKGSDRNFGADNRNRLNSNSSECTLSSGNTKLEILPRGGEESRVKGPTDEADKDEQDTGISTSGTDSNARGKQTSDAGKDYQKGEDKNKNENNNEVHKNERYSNCYICTVNFDENTKEHTCVPIKKIAIFYNCYACGVNLDRNVDHICFTHEFKTKNIKISKVVSLRNTYVYSCIECCYTTDVYDYVVRHCQNHYNRIEDSCTHCATCQLNIDVNRFAAHFYLHERDFKTINYSYTCLFKNVDALLDSVPSDVAGELRAQSIYATHCVRMTVVVDGPWQYSLYQCVQCKACVAPEDVERHCTSKCTYTNHLCSVCDRYFVSRVMRDNHEITHRNRVTVFRVIAFNSKEDGPHNLKLIESNEIQRRDTKVKSEKADIYKCQCGLCFVTKEVFKLHFLECNFTIQGGILCHKCPTARLYLPSELNKHLNLHHGDVKSEFVIHQINFQQNIEPCDAMCEGAQIERKSEPCSSPDVNDCEINLNRELLKQEDDSIVISDDDD